MSSRWLTCPRCQVRFQSEAVGTIRCAACNNSFMEGTATVSSASWFVIKNKQKVGPLSEAQMQQMSLSGQLQADDMVLQEGTRTWTPAAKVPSLFGVATMAPAPKGATNETVDDSRRTVAQGTTTVPPSATVVPTVPGYEILEELGRGGMGVVYKARQTSLKRLVALKMILSGGHAASSDLARFRAEAEAVARLQHPNIVQVHEIGEKDGVPYFSLEYVGGGTLAKQLAGTPLPPRDAAQLTATLALAIEVAHQAGIVHRDLKPANVLLAAGVPKIADFGLAKQLDDDSGQTRTGAIMGTPSYMSPEQASGFSKDIGPATDVYALGAILYETLTGRPPFKSATVLETLEQVRHQEPVSPHTLQPTVPRDLETICLKCLTKDPVARYTTAKMLAEDLQRFLSNQPILARPASLQERAVKFVKRNRLLVGSAASIFLLMFIGIIATSIQAARARKGEAGQREEARKAREQLAETYVVTAERLVQRGKHKEALESFQEALRLGHPDSIALRLNMARAHAALYNPVETRKILDELQDDPRLGEHKGSVLLLKGYTTMGGDVDAAMEMVRKALSLTLPPEEAAFARGLLAQTTPEAVDHCRAALRANPYHHPSHTMLGLLLVLLGRIDEAKIAAASASTLFPDDPNMVILNSILLGLEGKKQAALSNLEKLKDQVTPRQFRVLRSSIDMLHYLQHLDQPEATGERATVIAQWVKLLPDLDAIWPTAGVNVSEKPEVGAGQLLQMPPVLNRSLVEMMRAMAAVSLNPGNKDTHRKLDLVLRQHPEGMLYFFHGLLLYQQGQYAQARLQLLTSLRTPAIGNVRRSTLVMLMVCDLKQIATPEGVKDEALRRETAQHLQEFLRLDQPRGDELELCVSLAYVVGNHHLVRELTTLAERLRTPNLQDVLVTRLKAEEAIGNITGQLATANKMLKMNPKDEVALQHRTTAIRNLQEIVRMARDK